MLAVETHREPLDVHGYVERLCFKTGPRSHGGRRGPNGRVMMCSTAAIQVDLDARPAAA